MESQSFVMLLWLLGALFAGFFVPVRRARTLVQVNRAINALVYGLLLLIGFSLAKQDALGAQLADIGARAALLFACILGVNLPAMMALDRWHPWRQRQHPHGCRHHQQWSHASKHHVGQWHDHRSHTSQQRSGQHQPWHYQRWL